MPLQAIGAIPNSLSQCELGEKALLWQKRAKVMRAVSVVGGACFLISLAQWYRYPLSDRWLRRLIGTTLATGASIGATKFCTNRAEAYESAYKRKRLDPPFSAPTTEEPISPPTFPEIEQPLDSIIDPLNSGSLQSRCALVLASSKKLQFDREAFLPEDIVRLLYPYCAAFGHPELPFLISKLPKKTAFAFFHMCSDEVLDAIAKHHPQVTTLELRWVSGITDRGLQSVARLPQLQFLKLSPDKIGFNQLSFGPSLRFLEIELWKEVTLGLTRENRFPLIDHSPHLQSLIFKAKKIGCEEGLLLYLFRHTPSLLHLEIQGLRERCRKDSYAETADTDCEDVLFTHPTLQTCHLSSAILCKMVQIPVRTHYRWLGQPQPVYSHLRELSLSAPDKSRWEAGQLFLSPDKLIPWERLPHLKTLDLGNLINVEAEVPLALRHCPRLRRLYTASAPDEDALKSIADRSLPLKHLHIWLPIFWQNFGPLLQKIDALKSFSAGRSFGYGNPQHWNDTTLDELLKQSTLTTVHLPHCLKWDQDQWVGKLVQNNPQLATFTFGGELGAEGLKGVFRAAGALKDLDVKCKVGEVPTALNTAPNLTNLSLAQPQGNLSDLFAACPTLKDLTLRTPSQLDIATTNAPPLKSLHIKAEYDQLDDVLTFVQAMGWGQTLGGLTVNSASPSDKADPENIEQWRKTFAHLRHLYIDDFQSE